jgi:DNA-binding transcriptional LysR family regulator
MSRGEIDFLVTVKETAVAGLPTELLYRDNLVCISSYCAHSDGQRISLDTLCACRHVILNPRGVPISKPIDTALSALGMTRNLTVDVPSYTAVFKAMQSAELIAFLPELMCKGANPVKRLQTELKTPMTEIVAQWHPRMTNDARHIWLRERLLAAFQ